MALGNRIFGDKRGAIKTALIYLGTKMDIGGRTAQYFGLSIDNRRSDRGLAAQLTDDAVGFWNSAGADVNTAKVMIGFNRGAIIIKEMAEVEIAGSIQGSRGRQRQFFVGLDALEMEAVPLVHVHDKVTDSIQDFLDSFGNRDAGKGNWFGDKAPEREISFGFVGPDNRAVRVNIIIAIADRFVKEIIDIGIVKDTFRA